MPHLNNKVAQALIKKAITLYQNKQISLNTFSWHSLQSENSLSSC